MIILDINHNHNHMTSKFTNKIDLLENIPKTKHLLRPRDRQARGEKETALIVLC